MVGEAHSEAPGSVRGQEVWGAEHGQDFFTVISMGKARPGKQA